MPEPTQSTAPVAEGDTARPLSELRSTGLLWLINRTVFHPRGYALGVGCWSDGTIEGWTLLGDGTEPWRYAEDVDEDELFSAAEAFLASLRPNPLKQASTTPLTPELRSDATMDDLQAGDDEAARAAICGDPHHPRPGGCRPYPSHSDQTMVDLGGGMVVPLSELMDDEDE